MKRLLPFSVAAVGILFIATLLWTPAARAVRPTAVSPGNVDTAGTPRPQEDSEASEEDEEPAGEESREDSAADQSADTSDEGSTEESSNDGQQEADDEATSNEGKGEDSAKKESDGEKPPELDGVFQAVHADPVQIKVEEWSQLTVLEAVEHGAQVQAGDVLIRLETEDLEKAIKEAEHELRTGELALEEATVKYDVAQRSQELALRAAEAADRIATEELKDFVITGRDRQMKSLERMVWNAQNRLAYQEEELEQLERMYAADDLTEETEEIILKRTRDAVDNARYSLEVTSDSRRKGVEFELDRTKEQLEQAVSRATLALEEARRNAPQSLERQRLQLEKQKRDLATTKERLEQLRADLKQMTVSAPRAGVVYFGTVRRGKWTDPSGTEMMLQPGGSPKSKTDLLTIVELRPMTVRVAVPEKALRWVKPGAKATVKPVAFPDVSLAARVTGRSAIPVASGQFEATLELDASTSPPAEVVPGMNAKVTIDVKGDSAEADSADEDDAADEDAAEADE